MTSITPPMSKGERTRRALVDAARERFARDGYARTSVADISRDAGVGGTTAYTHFANKEDLFLAAVDIDLDALFGELGTRLVGAAAEGPLSAMILPAVLDIVDHHPLAHRLLAGLEPDFTQRVLGSTAFGRLRTAVTALLAAAQGEGNVRADLDPSSLADGVVASVVAMAMASVQIGDEVTDRYGPGFGTMLAAVLEVAGD